MGQQNKKMSQRNQQEEDANAMKREFPSIIVKCGLLQILQWAAADVVEAAMSVSKKLFSYKATKMAMPQTGSFMYPNVGDGRGISMCT